MEWRSVQELRPRASTSGGQSEAGATMGAVAVLEVLVSARAIDIQEATEVQERQLGWWQVSDWHCMYIGELAKFVSSKKGNKYGTYGFPSGPSTTPFGSFVGGVSVSLCAFCSNGPGAMSFFSPFSLAIASRPWLLEGWVWDGAWDFKARPGACRSSVH